MTSPEELGERLRALRKLHRLTQQELADFAGVSKSLVSKVEAGQRAGSWDLAAKVARSLGVSPAALMGLSPQAPAYPDRITECLPALRQAIVDYDRPRPGPPAQSLRVLADEVHRAGQLRLHARYGALGEILPGLLDDLTWAVHHTRGDEQSRAFWMLTAAYRCADAIAHKLGHQDLSIAAIERVQWAAERSRDDLVIATAGYVRAETYFVVGRAESGLQILEDVGVPIARRTLTDHRAASVYGALHARAAVLAAHGGLGPTARAHLKIARAMADLVDADVELFHTSFGPSSVKVHEVAVAVELRDCDAAVRRAVDWVPPASLPAERASHHFIDLARAQTWVGDHAGAVTSLLNARRLAPQHTRAHPGTHEVVQAILRRPRRSADAVRGLAIWLGMPC